MLNGLSNLDVWLFKTVNGLHNGLLDIVMLGLSNRTWMLLPVAVVLVWLLWRGRARERVAVVLMLASIGLSDFVTSGIIKDLVQRQRPCNVVGDVHYHQKDGWVTTPQDVTRKWKSSWSFPSSHAANTMAAAVWLWFLVPRLSALWIFISLGVGYSRLYLGVHYPSDVAAGWLMGALVALMVLQIFRIGEHRLKGRSAPQ